MNRTHQGIVKPAALPWRAWEVVVLVCITALAAFVRWPHLTRGIVGDEEALVQFNGWSGVWINSLTALHPPLYRLSFSAFLEPLTAVGAARSVSLLCGLLFLVALTDFSRSITQSRLAGLSSALWVTFIPVAIQFSTLFRPYALLTLLVVVHVWSISRWISDGFGRRYVLPTILTAMLLPQIHYLSVLWLGTLGVLLVLSQLLPWRKLWVYLPTVLAFAPFGWLILTSETSGRIRQTGDPLQSMEYLTSMGLVKGRMAPFPTEVSVVVIVMLVAIGLHWRRLSTTAKVCIVGGLSMGTAVMVSSTQHSMKSSTQILGVMFWVPLLVNGPFMLARWWPKMKIPIFVVAALLASRIGDITQNRYLYRQQHNQGRDRLHAFLEDWESHIPPNQNVGFLSPTDQRVARLHLTNSRINDTPIQGCGSDRYCFQLSEGYWRNMRIEDIPTNEPTAIIWTRNKYEPSLPDHCTVVNRGEQTAGVAHCAAIEP